MSEGRRRERLSSSRERECPLSQLLCSTQTLKGLDVPTLIGDGYLLFSSTVSNVHLFQKHPHRQMQRQFLPAFWASISQSKLTHKINHYKKPMYSPHRYLYLGKDQIFTLSHTLSELDLEFREGCKEFSGVSWMLLVHCMRPMLKSSHESW